VKTELSTTANASHRAHTALGRARMPGRARPQRRKGSPRDAVVGHLQEVSRGQALVELAIILPVLLVLVLAALDLGRLFFAQITVANAAREGAYEASYGGSYSAGGACGASNSVMCAILNESEGSLAIAPADVTKSCSTSGGCGAGAYGDVVTIRVTGHFSLLTPILAVFFGGTNVTFTSTAIADMVDTSSARALYSTPAPSATVAPTATPVPTATPIPTPSPAPTASPAPSAPTCPAPVSAFTSSQQNKNKPVDFVSTSTPSSGTCQITFWRWDYGDGATDAGNFPTTSHTYACKGCSYTVTLTVTNPFGSVSWFTTVTTQS
jgi:Flp pilus assembly protein TadG